MNKILFIILPFLSGCAQKLPFSKKPNNQEVVKIIPNKELAVFSPEHPTSDVFLIIIGSILFLCFGLRYIPMLYKKILDLTKKNK